MVNLTVSIAIPNITKFQCVAFDVSNGYVTVRVFYGPGTTRATDYVCILSDTVSASRGVIVNPAPTGAADQLTASSTLGVAGSLTNAIAAYRGGANHNAGLKALELRGVTDGWLGPELAGT